MRDAMLREYLEARKHNPELSDQSERHAAIAPRHEAAKLLEQGYVLLRRFCDRAWGSDPQAWRTKVRPGMKAVREHLGLMRDFSWTGRVDSALHLAAHTMIGMDEWLQTVPEGPDRAWSDKHVRPALKTLEACEQVLWDAFSGSGGSTAARDA